MRAKKSLGQHFLTDLNIARKIAEAISGGAATKRNGEFGEVAVSANSECSASTARTLFNPGRPYGERNERLGDTARSQPAVPETSPAAARRLRDAGHIHRRPSTSETSSAADVLEIGGGMGVLTQFLLERRDITLWGVEIDRESIAYMRERFPGFAPRLIEGDFLKMHLGERFPDGVKIIGNFPYNISSQIFFKVLANRDLVPEVVGMVQREVAQRIAEPPGSRSYGILSVLLQAWYDIEYLFTVNEGVFSPPPKVKSAVIRLTRNGVRELGCDEALFVKVVKAAFGQRRKMIRNSLRAVFGDFVDRSADGSTTGGAEHPFFTDRAEKLSVSQFVELTNWVADHTCHNHTA